MKKIVPRLLTFCVAIPLVVAIVRFEPKNHLLANSIVIILSALGAIEFAGLLKKKGMAIPLGEAAILGGLTPLGMTLTASFGVDGQVLLGALALGAGWVILSRIFTPKNSFSTVLGYTTAGFSTLLYPGFFMAWVISMTRWDKAGTIILMFLLIVIANDSLAWVAGNLFGKNNRGIIPASPNKSVAGYLGGIIASVALGAGITAAFPALFTPVRFPVSGLLAGALTGFVTGIAGSVGDLGESLLKRSVDAKDSGTLIPGRGGVLDSIDSIALAAPVFYAAYWFFFTK